MQGRRLPSHESFGDMSEMWGKNSVRRPETVFSVSSAIRHNHLLSAWTSGTTGALSCVSPGKSLLSLKNPPESSPTQSQAIVPAEPKLGFPLGLSSEAGLTGSCTPWRLCGFMSPLLTRLHDCSVNFAPSLHANFSHRRSPENNRKEHFLVLIRSNSPKTCYAGKHWFAEAPVVPLLLWAGPGFWQWVNKDKTLAV